MPFAYVTQPGAVVRKRGRNLVVHCEGETLASFGLLHLETLIVRGGVQLTTPAIRSLLAHGIEAAFLNARGEFLGHLASPRGGNVQLRIAQYKLQSAPDARLRLARRTVADKLVAMQDVLLRYAGNYPDPELKTCRKSLQEIEPTLDQAESLEQLLGIEGNAAAVYWRGFRRLNRSSLGFHGRSRRPPRDEVNALLSLGYVILTNELRALTEALGFDPYLGYYHEIKANRFSLALDLVEPFRHLIIDRMVLRLANLGRIKQEHFEGGEKNGFRLTTTGWRIFLTEYEERMLAAPSGALFEGYSQVRSWRELLQKHCLALRRALQSRSESDSKQTPALEEAPDA